MNYPTTNNNYPPQPPPTNPIPARPKKRPLNAVPSSTTLPPTTNNALPIPRRRGRPRKETQPDQPHNIVQPPPNSFVNMYGTPFHPSNLSHPPFCPQPGPHFFPPYPYMFPPAYPPAPFILPVQATSSPPNKKDRLPNAPILGNSSKNVVPNVTRKRQNTVLKKSSQSSPIIETYPHSVTSNLSTQHLPVIDLPTKDSCDIQCNKPHVTAEPSLPETPQCNKPHVTTELILPETPICTTMNVDICENLGSNQFIIKEEREETSIKIDEILKPPSKEDKDHDDVMPENVSKKDEMPQVVNSGLIDWMSLPKDNLDKPPDLKVDPSDAMAELKLNAVPDPISAAIYRRKKILAVRERKKHLNLPILDIQARVSQFIQQSSVPVAVINPTDLMPEKLYLCAPIEHHGQKSFYETIFGRQDIPTAVPQVSRLTKRKYKPWIRRDFESSTLHLRLMTELNKRSSPLTATCKKISIDYIHFCKRYLEQVNSLLSAMFWKGIDVIEYLQYMDYTVVVLYGQLVVGCALAAPDGYLAYIAVLPGWQGAGIASFMMYYLCQNLPRDVTLHVSANNSAMILYQKLGFKPEEFIVGFYDKYYAPDSEASKHALFIRLRK